MAQRGMWIEGEEYIFCGWRGWNKMDLVGRQVCDQGEGLNESISGDRREMNHEGM